MSVTRKKQRRINRGDGMTVRRDSYDAALDRIASGHWAIDSQAGLIISTTSGKPITMRNDAGYVYAQFKVDGTRHTVRAHRVIWESVHGAIPDGMEINHINAEKADNRLGNLEVVTPKQNTAHAASLGLRDQPTGEQGYSAKLTQAQVDAIRSLATKGDTQRSIAARFGIARSQVSKIIHRAQWNDSTST